MTKTEECKAAIEASEYAKDIKIDSITLTGNGFSHNPHIGFRLRYEGVGDDRYLRAFDEALAEVLTGMRNFLARAALAHLRHAAIELAAASFEESEFIKKWLATHNHAGPCEPDTEGQHA